MTEYSPTIRVAVIRTCTNILTPLALYANQATFILYTFFLMFPLPPLIISAFLFVFLWSVSFFSLYRTYKSLPSLVSPCYALAETQKSHLLNVCTQTFKFNVIGRVNEPLKFPCWHRNTINVAAVRVNTDSHDRYTANELNLFRLWDKDIYVSKIVFTVYWPYSRILRKCTGKYSRNVVFSEIK